MSNSDSDNPNGESSVNSTDPIAVVSPRNGDVPMVGQRSRAAADPLRSIRRSAIDGARRRRYIINLRMNRRIMSLSNNARSTLISDFTDILRGEYSPRAPTVTPPRTEGDIISYNIEVRESEYDDVNNSGTDNNNNNASVDDDNDLDGQSGIENEPAPRSFFSKLLGNIFGRSGPPGDNV